MGDHRNEVREEEPGLVGVGIEPEFAIGQRALLVETSVGNVLWDMVPLCTDDAVGEIVRRGGAAAIAISHPHYYSGMLEWSRALGGIPILLHAADREWVLRPDPLVEYWDGEAYELPGGLTLVRLGGHFAGGTVLHWPAGAAGRGALLPGSRRHRPGTRPPALGHVHVELPEHAPVARARGGADRCGVGAVGVRPDLGSLVGSRDLGEREGRDPGVGGALRPGARLSRPAERLARPDDLCGRAERGE